jgi:hypothetical protein
MHTMGQDTLTPDVHEEARRLGPALRQGGAGGDSRRRSSQATPSQRPGRGTQPRRRATAGTSPASLRAALPIFLRHGSPRVLIVTVLAAAALRAACGAWSVWDVVPVAATFAVWPIQEWLIHVFILHFKPVTLWGHTIDFRVPRKHRAHHRDPWNYEILFIPFHSFSYSLPIAAALWWAASPTLALALTGFTVHMALALHYEWIHFLVHTRVAPRIRFYERIWKNHRLHHFKNEHYWFGVTRLEGDWLLGTAPTVQSVPLSPTARTLLHAERQSGAAD